jgi:2-polyprenyl-6-methoxyphenol hydroxylase-like FAD-dependent oxidoreductase
MIDECTGAPHEFRGVYRGGLLRALQAAVPADRVRYGAPVQGVQQDDEGGWAAHHLQRAGCSLLLPSACTCSRTATRAGVTVRLEDGQELRASVVVGADGVRSRIARQLGLPEANYAGYIAYR